MNPYRLAIVSVLLALGSLPAVAGPSKYSPLPLTTWDRAAKELPCYMNDAAGYSVDLTVLCGTNTQVIPTSSVIIPVVEQRRSGSTSSGSSGGSGDGQCNTPDDRQSNGNRCGKTAASERPGGR